MLSTLGTSGLSTRNFEAPRSPELIPEQVRVSADAFISLLKEYYTFLNSADLPSSLLYSSLSEVDIDETSERYLSHIGAQIAAYVPVGTPGINRVSLYKKIVKYYYNTRGSRESASVFFRIFLDAIIELIDGSSGALNPQIQGWLSAYGGNAGGDKNVQAWAPYSYGIVTDQTGWDASYKALVHPIGFRYFQLLRIIVASKNDWLDLESKLADKWNYTNLSIMPGMKGWTIPGTLAEGMLYVTAGSHSPTSQPDVSVNGAIIRIIVLLILEIEGSRMVDARADYQGFLKFWDPTPLSEYGSLTIERAGNPFTAYDPTFPEGYTYFSNIGANLKYVTGGFYGLQGNSYIVAADRREQFMSLTVSDTASSSVGSGAVVVSMPDFVNFTKNSVTGTTGSTTLTLTVSDTNVVPGLFVSSVVGSGGPQFSPNTYITAVSGATITLNQAITSGTTGIVSFSGQIYNLSVPNAGNVRPSAQTATFNSFTKAISYGTGSALSYPNVDPRVIVGMSVSSSDPGIVFATGSTTITGVSTPTPIAVIPSVTAGEYNAFGSGTTFAPTSSVQAGLSSFPYLYNSGIVAGMSIAGANLQEGTVITANVSGSSLTSSSLTVPATGAIVNFNSSASYASGWYRVTHESGYNTMFVGSGGAGGAGYDSSAITVYSSGSTYRASSGYVGSQALSGYVDFYHTGGTIDLQAFQPSDLSYTSNVGHSASYTLSTAPYLQLSKSIPAPAAIINAISAISGDSGSTMSYTMSASSVVIQSDQIEGIFFGDSVTGFGIPPNTTVTGVSNKQTNGSVSFATIALSNATTLGSSDYKSTANPIISFQRPAGASGQIATISQALPSPGSGTITISSGTPSAAGNTLTFFRGQGYAT